MGLQVYRRKRKFDVTPEPRGRAARTNGNQFVIQKHAARRLHYDLRLELDGVMKSWAVTRGPSLVPGEKRLAVHVEDHPIEYNSFEGTIPAGEYGGGTVMIWDRGRWEPEGDPHRGLKKGHLSFTLEGEKLSGGWHLVRMHGRPGETKENWLLIKANDDAARDAKAPDVLEELPDSVVSGRSIPEIAEGKGKHRVWHSNRSVKENMRASAIRGNGAVKRKSARAAREPGAPTKKVKKRKSSVKRKKSHGSPLPDFVPPSLATLRARAPSEAGWLHEIKFDGYRMQARLNDGEVALLTRKGLDWTERFSAIAEAVAALPAETALLDGEIVVEDERGLSNFSMLQAALKEGAQGRFIYYLFDLLYFDGDDLRDQSLRERKAILKRLLARNARGALRYSDHFDEDGQTVLENACRMGLEGIVSKRADAPYRSGRSESFIKTKCANAQELVVGGYSPSTVMPKAIGALAVGYYDEGKFTYAGRIGTGYSQATARDLWKRLHPLETAKPPFDVIPLQERRRRDVHWVEPKLVIEAQFRGWTGDLMVRQAAFKGVREDKPAKEVVREAPQAIDTASDDSHDRRQPARIAAEATKRMAKTSNNMSSKTSKRKAKTASGARTRAKQSPACASTSAQKAAASAREPDVRLTHPDRVYWVDVGVTKQDLADYYRDVWTFMAPHVVGRPLALVRCPEGTKGECFFQKHAAAGLAPERLRTVIDSKGREVLAIDDLDGLLSLVQAGVLEVHVRGSRIDRLDHCDRIVFDLDPGQGVGWKDIIAAARAVRARLQAIKLESFVKLSGGKGLHVVVPVTPVDWDTTKTFVQAFAQAMAADEPERYIAKMTKAVRSGKIFIDYLRNSLEQTAVVAYSTRARAGAPVSVPVSWEELGRTKAANQYTVLNLMQRLSSLKGNPWKDINRIQQSLPHLNTLKRRG